MVELLRGIRVIDFGRFIAGPYCAMMLADFGADVIRVERREGGEDRPIGPVTASGEGGLYLNVNRNKRGMTLDFRQPRAGEIKDRLVRTADIVVANLPIAVLEQLGLDYSSLRAIKKDIILVTASAFGSEGPHADRLGFDGVAQAMSGAMGLTGFEGAPVRSIVPYADYGTALHGAFGALAALYRRQETGDGEWVEVSLLETGLTFMAPLLTERAATDIRRTQLGNTSFFTSPGDTFRTRDGWVVVATAGGPMFRRWAKLMDRADLIDDERFGDDRSRAEHHETIHEIMAPWCAARETREVVDELTLARIPCGPVHDLDEVAADPQVRSRQLLESVEQEDGASMPLATTPLRFHDRPRSPLRRAPGLGEHTDEVLGELGFDTGEITALRGAGVV